MAENTFPETDQPLPLRKLVRLSRGNKRASISEELLPRIDLVTLRHKLLFYLQHYFSVSVVLTVQKANRIETTVTISTKETEWPEPNQYFVDLFYAAVGAAAQKVLGNIKEEKLIVATVHGGSKPLVFECHFHMITGGEILANLRDKLTRIEHELPAVLNVIASGPKLVQVRAPRMAMSTKTKASGWLPSV